MDSFNFDGLVDTRDFGYDGSFPNPKDYGFGTGSFPTNEFGIVPGEGRFIFLPESDNYGIDFGTGGYIPEPGFTYENVFGGAGGTEAKKSGGFLDNLVGSVGDLFTKGSTPSNPYASSQVSRSFGEPRSSYVDDTKQRMGSLLANVIDSFKIGNSPRSVI
jgi:hypothetical protein